MSRFPVQKGSVVYRHELKTLMMGLFLLPVLMGCGTRTGETADRPNKEQGLAIAEIQRLGGKVTFDEEAQGKPIYAVDFSETNIGDDALKSVAGLTELKVLILARTQVTDSGLKRIEGLTQLRHLILYDTPVTDAGLEHTEPLVHLETLDLSNTQVTDAGLQRLGELRELGNLSLSETRITDEGLKHLKELKRLRRLYTWGTEVTPAGLEELKQALPNLRESGDDCDQP